jgi:hypothetical protein
MFKLKIKTDNEAFTDDKKAEIIRILKDAILKLEQGNERGILLDVNGNLVGEFRLTNR